MASLKQFLILMIFVLMLNSCEIYNPKEDVPSYIRINSIKLTDNPSASEGSLSNKITDAWVYLDDNFVGAFEMPATIPILDEGIHKLTVKAGIKLNGISSTRAAYPFFETVVINNFDLVKAKTIDITDSLKTRYSSDISPLLLNEDFEQVDVAFVTTSRSDTMLYKVGHADNVFDGSFSGVIYLDNIHPMFEARTAQSFNLPRNNSPVFLELNYRSEAEITIGYFANSFMQSSQHSFLVINPSASWNKVYVNLTPAISRETEALSFNIFIGANLLPGSNHAEIYMDNIKLVYFKN